MHLNVYNISTFKCTELKKAVHELINIKIEQDIDLNLDLDIEIAFVYFISIRIYQSFRLSLIYYVGYHTPFR